MDWRFRLIVLYVFICGQFHNEFRIHCQRFSNNNKPEFTDEEVVTIFLYGIIDVLKSKPSIIIPQII